MIHWLWFIFFASSSSATIVEQFSFSPLGQFDNGYKEERFNFVLEQVKEIYTPIFADLGGTFAIEADWTDGAVNMWAWRYGDEYILEIPGGMARYYLISEEGFLLSICHELGHLLGGQPAHGNISYEGQSDYYATKECTEIMFPKISPEQLLAPSNEVADICQHQRDDYCSRTLMGALSLTSYYAEIEKSPAPKLSTPSPVQVDKTLTDHPPAQCRLDTFYAGFEDRDRPRCWFAGP